MLRPQLVTYVLSALMEKKVPFVFSYASPFAQVPPELLKDIEEYGDGLAVKFAPQWTIINHPAAGYFIVRPCVPPVGQTLC